MSALWSDLRFAVRALRLAPGFTLVALIVLTLGIGATTAIYSVVDAVVLRGLPYPDEPALVRLSEGQKGRAQVGSVAPQNFLDWRDRSGGVFSAIGASGGGNSPFRPTDDTWKDVRRNAVTAGFLSALGVRPEIGTLFDESNETEGARRVVLISHALWQHKFAGDPAVIGRTITSSDGGWQIIGVLPATFGYPVAQPELDAAWVPWIPQARERDRNANGRSWYLTVVGRLAPGVSVDAARSWMDSTTKDLSTAYPRWFDDRDAAVTPLRTSLIGDMRVPLLMLLGAVALVMLIACANVANLVLVRSTSRTREIAIRSSLGASRWDITRALLVEGLLLSIVGAACGALLAWWSVGAVKSLLPAFLFRATLVAIDGRVLLVTMAVAIVTGVCFGLLPAWQFTRPRLSSLLNESNAGATSGTGRRSIRTALLIAEVALAVVLLVGASMFLTSFARVMGVDIGFNYRALVSTQASVDSSLPATASASERQEAAARQAAAIEDARRFVASLPGVESAAIMTSGASPLTGNSATTTFAVIGTPELPRPQNTVEIKAVAANYFETVGMTFLRGHGFGAGDRPDSGGVVLSALAVEKFFGGDDPIGRPVNLGGGQREVIGVVPNTRTRGPEAEIAPEVYSLTGKSGYATIVARMKPGATLTEEMLTSGSAGAGVKFSAPRTMSSELARLVQPRKLNAVLVAIFGVLALLIAAVGIYGVMSYVVAQRSREIGVRMALGAQPAQVRRSVLVEAVTVMGVGVAIGGAGAFALGRFIEAYLFHVDGRDPSLYGAAVAVLALAGVVAALIPAVRASRVDPITVLRT